MNSYKKMMASFPQFQRYLHSLGAKVTFVRSESLEATCPLLVSAHYDACIGTLFATDWLFLFSRQDELLTPEMVLSHHHLLASQYSLPILVVFQSGSQEFCTSLLKWRLPFVVTGRQCYIPAALVLFNAAKFTKPLHHAAFLSPIGQVLLLDYLLHHDLPQTISFHQLKQNFPTIHKVYLSRGTSELEHAGLASLEHVGRQRILVWKGTRRQLWEQAQPLLRNPVLRRIRVTTPLDGHLRAGLTALAQYTNLNDNDTPTFAIHSRQCPAHLKPLEYSGNYLELWRYDPKLLTRGGATVDKLSLYLSLKNHPDPRVQGELNPMLEDFQW